MKNTVSPDATPQRPLTKQEALEAVENYSCELLHWLGEVGVTPHELLHVVRAIERRHGIHAQ
jgi:hypothetical protein